MDRIPMGISRLDSVIGGGAPAGSVVLLATEVGAGGREFLYTAATMNGLATADEELFDLYYGDLASNARPPEEVHYLSFTAGESALRNEMRYVLEDDLVEMGTAATAFLDLSGEYFQLSQVPTEWYLDEARSISGLADRHDRRGVLDTLGGYLNDHATDNLVLIDSVTDLISAAGEEMDWTDVALLLKGLKKASYRWGGLILLLATQETMSERQLGVLMEATDGTLLFDWESGGSERARTLVVKRFRGVLSRLEAENVVRFETEIHEGGFDISDVRKIR